MHSKKKALYLLFFLSSLLLSGCDDKESANIGNELKDLKQQQDNQKKTLEQLQKQQTQIISDLQLIASATQKIATKQNVLEFTEFDPTHTHYFILNNGSVELAGRILSISPVDKGSVIHMSLVNLLSIPISDIGFQVTWGRAKPEENEKATLNRQQPLFSTAISSNLALLPGEWQNIDLTLNGLPPNDLRYLKISINMDRIILGAGETARREKTKAGKKYKN